MPARDLVRRTAYRHSSLLWQPDLAAGHVDPCFLDLDGYSDHMRAAGSNRHREVLVRLAATSKMGRIAAGATGLLIIPYVEQMALLEQRPGLRFRGG